MVHHRVQTNRITHRLRAAAGLWLVSLAAAGVALAQVPVPRDQPSGPNPDPAFKVFDAQHLKDLPYSGSLPKPAFPSTERVQRTFTAAYVYDYAYSAYQPSVTVPIQSTLQAKRDTPEAAFVALSSAMRTGNYEAFVAGVDDPVKDQMKSRLKDPQSIAALTKSWKDFFLNKRLILVDRVETIGYVILNSRLEGGPTPVPFPMVLKDVKGNWVLTNEVADTGNQLLYNFRPDLAGLIYRVQPVPTSELSDAARQQREAQADFLKSEETRTETIHPGH